MTLLKDWVGEILEGFNEISPSAPVSQAPEVVESGFTRERSTLLAGFTLERTMEQLPVELVHRILRRTAIDFVSTDRTWVVQLALVSRFFYQLVSPVLYHTMVVTIRNHPKLNSLAREDSNSHVFQAVRNLVADEWLDSWDGDRLRALFATVTSIDASRYLVRILSRSPIFRPRRLALRYGQLAELPETLPASTLSHITHLTGYLPQKGYCVHALADCISTLLEAMPAVTHVALEVLSVSQGGADDDSASDVDVSAAAAPLDLAALGRTLGAILQHPRIEAVAMRIAAGWISHWPAVLRIAEDLKDFRLYAWKDTRTITSWTREALFAEADAWAGKDIWSEAQQLWRPDA